ncbi:MAG: hypothetical protein IJA97_05150 [Clostridia bacterium]|nr:hypothetical protein [Clostridia bacterium]
MAKEFFADIEYNRQKRRSAIILNSLLIVLTVGTASIFIAKRDWVFSAFFLLFTIIPMLTIPSAYKNFPVHGKPVLTVTDKEVLVMDMALKLKDISSFKAIITLPPCKTELETVKMLEEFRDIRPDEAFDGDFDIYYYNEKGKKQTVFSHVKNVVGAIEALIELGVKNYSLVYSAKKNTVKSTFDFKSDMANRRQAEMSKAGKKSKTKQLI